MTKSKYGNPKMIFSDYEFIQDNKSKTNENTNKANWRCTHYGKNLGGCGVRAVARGDLIEFNGLQHNHLPATEKLQAIETKNKILERARTTNEEPRACIAAVQRDMPLLCANLFNI